MTWDRVDLKNRLILLDKTKNGERREIPVNDILAETLADLIRHVKTDYVFYDPNTLKAYFGLNKAFKQLFKKAHILHPGLQVSRFAGYVCVHARHVRRGLGCRKGIIGAQRHKNDLKV